MCLIICPVYFPQNFEKINSQEIHTRYREFYVERKTQTNFSLFQNIL